MRSQWWGLACLCRRREYSRFSLSCDLGATRSAARASKAITLRTRLGRPKRFPDTDADTTVAIHQPPSGDSVTGTKVRSV